MTDRVATQCDQCGQRDDHPKVHLGATTYHHDCLPYTEKRLIQESSPEATQIIAAAECGTHGSELLEYIQALRTEETTA